jgi:hypothetical protein
VKPIQPISGSIPFRRINRVLPIRPIGAPWHDGHGARSDDDREELGGAARWIAPEVVERARELYRGSVTTRPSPTVRAPRAASPPPPRPSQPQLSTQSGARTFQGGSGWDAWLAYGDLSDALIRIEQESAPS